MERQFKITVDGKPYRVTVEDVTEGGMTIPQPGDMVVPTAAPAAAAAAAAPAPAAESTAAPDDVASPLAGVLVSVEVSVGQDVNSGDKVAVIEAMKMKTSVFAHRAGKVSIVAVKAGDAVDAGQALMTIS